MKRETMTKKKLGDRAEELPAYACSCAPRKRHARLRHVARAWALALAAATLGFTVGAPSLMARKEKPPTTKTVRGEVLDASGNGIAGAAVEMTNLSTGEKTAIFTGTEGSFVFTGLKTFDDYQFRATYKGKSSETRKVSSWDTRMRVQVNLHIPPPKEE
jgi:Carboxypeptidase regulatory-like domain